MLSMLAITAAVALLQPLRSVQSQLHVVSYQVTSNLRSGHNLRLSHE